MRPRSSLWLVCACVFNLAVLSGVDRAYAVSSLNSGINWAGIGPRPISNVLPDFGGYITGSVLSNATGRVTAIAIDPQGRIFVGTAGGGVWFSTDAGTTFGLLGTATLPPYTFEGPSNAIGAIALETSTNPPTVYV